MKHAIATAQLAQEDVKRQIEEAARQVQEANEIARVHEKMARRMAQEAKETAEQARIQCEEAAKQNLDEHNRLVAMARGNARKIIEKKGELSCCPICRGSKPEVLFGCGHRFCHNCANRMGSCDSCGQIVQVRVVGQ